MTGLSEFTTSYEGYAGKSYLTISVPVSEKLIQYQAEMLAKNHIDFLLPLSVQRLNNNWKLSYEITSKIPLEKILERKSLKYEEFESIIKQIGRLSLNLKDYLLDLSSIVFDNSYIYCDPADLSLYFLYLPVKVKVFASDSVKEFIQKMIVKDIRLLDDSSGSLLKRLLDVLKSETFTPEQLLKCINFSQVTEKQRINKADDYGYEAGKVLNVENNAISSERLVQNHKKYTEKALKPVEGPVLKNNRKSSDNFSLKYPMKSYIISGIVNILLIGLTVYIFMSKKGSDDLASTLLGLILIGFAVNYFVITRLFSEDKRIISREESIRSSKSTVSRRFVNEAIVEDIILPSRPPVHTQPVFNTDTAETDIEKIYYEQQKNDYERHNLHDEPAKSFDESDFSYSNKAEIKITDEISEKNNHTDKFIQDKTVVLGYPSAGNIPYLQSHSCPTEKFSITKDSVLLGRLTGSVDYTIQNVAVGKIHAEIIKRDGNYYIIDLNSVNGTYVNNERINCNTEVELKNGDIITLANESYTFVI